MFRRLILVPIVAGVVLLLFQYGTANINSRLVRDNSSLQFNGIELDNSLMSSWALIAKAQKSLQENDVNSAEQLALTALKQNPTSGRAAAFLLSVYSGQKRQDDAQILADLSSELWPAHTFTRSRLADYWLSQQRLDKAVDEWNVLLIRNPDLRKTLFPVMVELIQDSQAEGLFQKFIDAPPVWWPSFFLVLSRELPLDKLRLVYSARMSSNVSLDDKERQYYQSRLVKEQLWVEAYNNWFLGLTEKQESYTGLIFDGGFESDLFNSGFDWQLLRSKNPLVKVGTTYGIKGRKALQVVMRGKEPLNFRHVYQRLLLSPDTYQLSFRYRADSFKSQKGLSWRLRCVSTEAGLLAQSDPILNKRGWSTLSLNFTVSTSCPVQILRLESTSRFSHEQSMTGSLWFDEVKIIRKKVE